MKNALITLVTLAVIFASSCQKKDSTQVVYIGDSTKTDTPNNIDDSYYIPGLADKSTFTLSRMDIDFTVTQNTITDTRVNLSLGDLPPNTNGYLSVKSGYPTYNSSLHLDFLFTPPGIYPIKLTAKTEQNNTKEYYFDLEVKTPNKQECNQQFKNGFTTDNFTLKDAVNGDFNSITPILYDNGNQLFLNKVLLYIVSNTGFDYYVSYDAIHPVPPTTIGEPEHVQLNMNCENGNLTIPKHQLIGQNAGTGDKKTFNISGNGKVDLATNKYTITYQTSYDDNGTERTGNFTMSGDFKY